MRRQNRRGRTHYCPPPSLSLSLSPHPRYALWVGRAHFFVEYIDTESEVLFIRISVSSLDNRCPFLILHVVMCACYNNTLVASGWVQHRAVRVL